MFAPCSDSDAPPGCSTPRLHTRAGHQIGPLFEYLQRYAYRDVIGIGAGDSKHEAGRREALRERVDLPDAPAPFATGKSHFNGGTCRRGDDARNKALSLAAHGVLHATFANFHGGGAPRKLRVDFEVPAIIEDQTCRLLAETPFDSAAAFDNLLREGVERQGQKR